jgi:hypothetical protein
LQIVGASYEYFQQSIYDFYLMTSTRQIRLIRITRTKSEDQVRRIAKVVESSQENYLQEATVVLPSILISPLSAGWPVVHHRYVPRAVFDENLFKRNINSIQ